MAAQLQDYRCLTCHKLLFKGNLCCSLVEIKCKGCKQLNTFNEANSVDTSACGEDCPCRKG